MDNSERQRRKKWQVAGLCWGALTMVSMIRIAMAVAAPTLMETYDIFPPKTSVLSLAIPGPATSSPKCDGNSKNDEMSADESPVWPSRT